MMTTERQQILDADNLEHVHLFERRAADAKERGDIMAANIWLRCAQRERSSIKKRLTSNAPPDGRVSKRKGNADDSIYQPWRP